jgi:hypothetical protein
MEKNDMGMWVVMKDEKNIPRTWAFDGNAHIADVKKAADKELEAAKKERAKGTIAERFGAAGSNDFGAGFKKK